MSTIELRGITWNHTRGYLPMVATAQRFCELHPDVAVHWKKRSLQDFADLRLEHLVDRFDLLAIDHPFAGFAAAHDVLAPLDLYLPPEFLADQAAHPVGRSHESYCFGDHQWALAIDAAAPVSGYRTDLLEKVNCEPPRSWPELMELAGRGLVALSGVAIDSLCHFYMLCTGLGEEPFSRSGAVVTEEAGTRALEMLRGLMERAVPGCSRRNPIAVWELLTSGDAAAYCPFAYGYSNYARREYCRHPLEFGGLVTIGGLPCRSTLGGAGLAISSRCRNMEAAVEYAMFTAGPASQTGIYFDAGGQPGYRRAWLDERINRAARNFFRNTLPTLDEAWLRPRWNGYLDFQDAASAVVHEYVWNGGEAGAVMERLNALLRQTGREGAL